MICVRSIFVLLLIIATLAASSQKSDIILFNGKVFTADSTQLYVQAIAIKGNKIIKVGSNDMVEKTNFRSEIKGCYPIDGLCLSDGNT